VNIAVNGLLLKKENSGVGQTIYGLLNRIAYDIKDDHKHRYTFIVGKEFSLGHKHPRFRVIETGIDPDKRLRRILWENFFMHFVLKANGIDLYHSPGYVLPLFFSVPSIVTIHDIIALRFPQYCRKSNVMYYKIFLPYAVGKAERVITISKTVKEELVRYLRVPEEKISVIYPGIDNSFRPVTNSETLSEVRTRYNVPEKFILFVGNLEPKKNLKRLLDAFCKMKALREINHKLVITGKKGWKYKDIFKTVQNSGLTDDVIFTGYCRLDDLPALYSMADLFTFPSLYEGFGIPPLEAMACGTPVLASDRGALPETTGGCALLINPEDIDDIVRGMITLLFNGNMRKSCVHKGRKWAGCFTWERATKETLKVYEEVLYGKKYLEYH